MKCGAIRRSLNMMPGKQYTCHKYVVIPHCCVPSTALTLMLTNTCEINLNISEYFSGTPMGQGNIELTKAFLKVSLAGDFSA